MLEKVAEQLKLMPKLGDTKSDKRNRLVWDACPDCGIERWQRNSRLGKRCPTCAMKEAQARPEVRAKRSASLKGRKVTWINKIADAQRGKKKTKYTYSDITGEKRRKASRENWENPVTRAKIISGIKESRKNPEFIKNSRERKIAEWQDPIMREKITKGIIESQKSEEFRENARKMQIEKWQDPIMREKITQAVQRSHNTPEFKENGRIKQIEKWQDPVMREKITQGIRNSRTPELRAAGRIRKLAEWRDPVKKEKLIKSMLEMKSPNNHEQMVQKILDDNYPNEWKFVGNGEVIINGLSPDFINVNGKKWIIEYFGVFWHRPQDEPFKIKKYAEYGYKTLVIWSNKVKGKDDIARVIDEWVKENA